MNVSYASSSQRVFGFACALVLLFYSNYDCSIYLLSSLCSCDNREHIVKHNVRKSLRTMNIPRKLLSYILNEEATFTHSYI